MTAFRVLPYVQTDPPKTTETKHKLDRHGRVIVRKPSSVTGVTLHQTACIFGPKADPEKRYRRSLNVACHALAYNDGTIAFPNPVLWYVWHGNALNASTLGLEIEAVASGTERPGEVSPLCIETAREALRVLVERGRAEGCPLQWIYAHRQSSPTRRADPGEVLWREVGLWGVEHLGLKTQTDRVWRTDKGSGRPIPTDWDPSGVGRY